MILLMAGYQQSPVRARNRQGADPPGPGTDAEPLRMLSMGANLLGAKFARRLSAGFFCADQDVVHFDD